MELTLEEKLAQLVCHGSPSDFVKDGKFSSDLARKKYPNGLFGLMVPIDLSPEEIGEWTSQMLDCFSKISPVPPILMCESLHGILGKGTTVFPQSIGMGASFDPDLMARVGKAIGKEARALGISLSLAPDLDLGREPRWGRIEETYGEDSHLVSKMGEAYVKGLLGKDKKYAACVKHFAAHGSPKAGVNLSAITVTEHDLYDRYLPPFEAALKAGASCVMPAYSSLNGAPCHSSKRLMNDILRDKLGFDGVVISDFGALEMLTYFQCVAENARDAAKLATACEIDVEAPNAWAYGSHLKEMVDSGEIYIKKIDEMVLRILKLKEKLGLFEWKKPSAEEIKKTVNCREHKMLAREAAQKSIVLLKNDGALPLRGEKIAVVGPNATSVQLGDYALPKLSAKSPYEAIREYAEKRGGEAKYAKGCDVYGTDTSGFSEAEKIASEADKIVCIIGGKSMKGYGVGWGSEEETILTSGEGCDMHDLTPGGMQLELVRKMIKTGKPTTVVMVDGRPETLFDVVDGAGALIAAWYPGEEGSEALASLLFGEVNFSAKLPVTFPKHTGQLPLCYDEVLSNYGFYHSPGTPEKPGRDYVFLDTKPQFEFGYGIGYSKITYENLALSLENDGLKVKVTVKNESKMDANEKVLIFMRDEVASVPQPIKKLVAIESALLAAGESKKITVSLPREKLTFTGTDLKKRFESGWFTVTVGDLSDRIYIGEN